MPGHRGQLLGGVGRVRQLTGSQLVLLPASRHGGARRQHRAVAPQSAPHRGRRHAAHAVCVVLWQRHSARYVPMPQLRLRAPNNGAIHFSAAPCARSSVETQCHKCCQQICIQSKPWICSSNPSRHLSPFIPRRAYTGCESCELDESGFGCEISSLTQPFRDARPMPPA